MTRQSWTVLGSVLVGGVLAFLGGLVVGTRIAGPSKQAMAVSRVSIDGQNAETLFVERSSLAKRAIEQHLEILESERFAIGELQYRVGRVAAMVRLAIESDATGNGGAEQWQKAVAACREAGFCKCSKEELTARWGKRHKQSSSLD